MRIEIDSGDSTIAPGKYTTVASAQRGGCGSEDCNCSPGHWVSVITREKVIQFNFPNRMRLLEFIQEMKEALSS
jgi:hypothetical protein